MRFSLIRATLIALFSVSFTAQSYGELIMIRHPPEIENGKRVQKLTCQSENDGDALVWNGRFKYSTDHGAFEKYFVKYEECAPGYKCEIKFNHPKNEWERVHSADRPMNPVFDFRWEGFSDYNGNREHLDNLKRSGTFVFSVRGSKDVVLRFGEDDNTMANHSCFMITLAASKGTMSKISTCVGDQGSDNSQSSLARILVSELEWRTYIVNWDGSVGKIKVEESRKDLRQVAKTILEQRVGTWVGVKDLFVENFYDHWIRFHFYNYRVTEKKDIYLTSDIITKEFAPKYLTVELMVSLCAKCQIEVSVIDENNTAELDRKTIKSTDDSSVWQRKILNLSWNARLQNVRIKLKTVTHVTRKDFKIWWAIGLSLFYQSDGLEMYPFVNFFTVASRESTRKITLSPNMPNFACQQLSKIKERRSVVYSFGNITNISLTSHFPCHGSCYRTSICNSQGCTCAPGFRGNNCDEECSQRHYGYNCKETCQRCGNRKCDKINGRCQRECLDYFVPRGCTKELIRPHVWCIKETGVHQDYYDSDFDEKTNLQFEFKKVKGNWKHVSLSLDPSSSTSRWSEKSIEKLEPMKEYNVRAVLHNTKGPITNFSTSCWQLAKPQNMSVVFRDTSNVTLKWKYNPRFWEKTESFEVRVESLDSKLSKDPAAQRLNETIQSFLKQQVHQVNLTLSTLNNYKFSIRAIDRNFKNSTAVSVWYLIPDRVNLTRSEEEPVNSTIKRLRFKLPHFESATEESAVNRYVIISKSSTCPSLERDEHLTELIDNTATNITRPNGVEKGENPACLLRFDETYVVLIAMDITVDETSNSTLNWLTILPVTAVCCLLFYIVYRNHKRISMNMKPPPIRYVHSHNAPEDAIYDNDIYDFGDTVTPDEHSRNIGQSSQKLTSFAASTKSS